MSAALLKKLALAAGILVLLWVVYLYRQVPHSQSPFGKAGAPVQHVMLEQGPKKVELVKRENKWKVSSGTGSFYPADDSMVQTLLSGLKDIQLEDEISDRTDRAADYDVTIASGTRVRLFGENETALGEGLFGKQAPDYAHLYFRYADKPNVYLARGMIRGELGSIDVNSWRSHQLLDIPEAKIQAITMEGKGFKTELVRTSTDVWTLNGKTVEPGPVNALVGTLAHLRFNDFVDSSAFPALTYEGLTASRVIVKGADAPVELRIGAQEMKSKRYPVATNQDVSLVWLPESIVHSLQQKPSAFPEKK